MGELVLITGASGGLGRAMAVELVRQGCAVVGTGRRADAMEETAQLAGEGFTPLVADVAGDPAPVFEAVDKIGPLTVLINNAAVYPRSDILDETPDSFAATVAINLGGQVAYTHHALKRFVEVGHGRIVNVSTFADVAPIPASAAYATSKGAGRVFTKSLVADLADRFPDIVINDWMPGSLNTKMGIPEGVSPEVAAKWGAAMALWHNPSLTGTTWERNREIPPHRGLKERLKNKLLMRKPVIRTLPDAP